MRLLVALLLLVQPALLRAQTTVRRAASLRATPDGVALATLTAGTRVAAGRTRGAWTQVTLEGYVHRSVAAGKRDTFALSAGSAGALMRDGPSRQAGIRARMQEGMGLVPEGRHGEWLHVKRTGWVRTTSLAAASRRAAPRRVARAPAKHAAAPDSITADSAGGSVEPDSSPGPSLALDRRVPLRLAPDGPTLAIVDSNTPVTSVGHDRGWVRVQVEGWVRESELVPVGTNVLTVVSAADLRAQPDKYKGQTVRWRVQKIAVQTADPLHRGLAPDEPYILARGPGDENSLLYLALPPSLVDQARRIDPLAWMIVTARVREGSSQPSGVPLLDVISIAQP